MEALAGDMIVIVTVTSQTYVIPTANETAVTSVTNVSVHLYQNHYPFTLKQQQYTKCPTDPNPASRAAFP